MTEPRVERKRLDFTVTVSRTKDPNVLSFVMTPDPRRYEWIEHEGQQCLLDRLDRELIPQRALEEMAQRLNGRPMYYQPPTIGDVATYIQSRVESIGLALQGHNANDPEQRDRSADFLDSIGETTLGFAVLSIDLVHSTELAQTLEPRAFATVISVLLGELSRIVPMFHGHVLKFTGDGLIAYFAEPSFNTMNDLALDCALTMRRLITEAITPSLESAGFPAIAVRIGLEAGDAVVTVVGDFETKRQKDILGLVVSVAAKVQGLAPSNGIYLGHSAVTALHTTWRQKTRLVVTGPEWAVKTHEGVPYPVHELVIDSSEA